jgi:hypothetical protein
MSPVIPFRRRSSLPSFLIVLGTVAAAVIGFAATSFSRRGDNVVPRDGLMTHWAARLTA